MQIKQNCVQILTLGSIDEVKNKKENKIAKSNNKIVSGR